MASKQDVVFKMVKEAKWTRDEIKEAAGCTAGAFASYLTGLRNAAKYSGQGICPVEVDDGNGKKVFKPVTYKEAMAVERGSATRTSSKSPEERYVAAHKRGVRTENAFNAATERLKADPKNKELQLRNMKAEADFGLAAIELGRALEALEAIGKSPEDILQTEDPFKDEFVDDDEAIDEAIDEAEADESAELL